MQNLLRTEKLKNSPFRQSFELDGKDLHQIAYYGTSVIERHAKEIVSARLGEAIPKKDGEQTPFKGHPVFKAQHATGTCCRKCLSGCHKIPQGRPLSEGQGRYVVKVIMKWINDQVKIKGLPAPKRFQQRRLV